MRNLLGRLGAATAGHPWRTLLAWLLATAALIGAGQAAGGAFVNDFRVPGAEAQRAADLAQSHFPAFGAASADIVFHTETGTLRDGRKAAAIAATLAEIRRQPDVVSAPDPLNPPTGTDAGGMLDRDHDTAITTVRYGKDVGELTTAAYHRLDAAADKARRAGVDVHFRGMVVELASEPATSWVEAVGLGAALLVLLVAFGSVVAAGLPILVALAGLAAGTALVLLAGAAIDIPTAAPIVAVMLGLGAGIDYALFVVTRFRRHLAAGDTPREAASRAVASAGHAVVFAGATVVVAILGLLFTGLPFVGGMGIAAALTVAVMMLASLTLLPALLGLLGHRVNSWRIGRRAAREERGHLGAWGRWGAHLNRHRVAYALGATALLLAMATPVLSLRLGTPDDGNAPATWTQRQAYDTVAAEFGPGWNAPLLLAVRLPDAPRSEVDAVLSRLDRALRADREVRDVTPPARDETGKVALLTVIPRHAPQDARVTDLVHRVRDTIAPDATRGTGARVYVGGMAALMIDMADAVAERLPWVVLAVVTAGALLLVAMFRAPLVAMKAAVMSVLSIGAAYGVLVAVFQWGWGLSLLGIDAPVPIMSIVPMLLFAVLFGLSMDYEVFLLSAVKESYDAGEEARHAVTVGLAGTARVITAAAAIMTVVFASFVGIDDTLVKMIGVGLATAVIVDATVVRIVLGPAILGLLGGRAWWPQRPFPPHEGAGHSHDRTAVPSV